MRERKKSDASGLHSDSNRRGHFIDFRVTFHVAQRAEFSGCVTAENDFSLAEFGRREKLPHQTW